MKISNFFIQNNILIIELKEKGKNYSIDNLRIFYIRNESQIDKIILYIPIITKKIFTNFEEVEKEIVKLITENKDMIKV